MRDTRTECVYGTEIATSVSRHRPCAGWKVRWGQNTARSMSFTVRTTDLCTARVQLSMCLSSCSVPGRIARTNRRRTSKRATSSAQIHSNCSDMLHGNGDSSISPLNPSEVSCVLAVSLGTLLAVPPILLFSTVLFT